MSLECDQLNSLSSNGTLDIMKAFWGGGKEEEKIDVDTVPTDSFDIAVVKKKEKHTDLITNAETIKREVDYVSNNVAKVYEATKDKSIAKGVDGEVIVIEPTTNTTNSANKYSSYTSSFYGTTTTTTSNNTNNKNFINPSNGLDANTRISKIKASAQAQAQAKSSKEENYESGPSRSKFKLVKLIKNKASQAQQQIKSKMISKRGKKSQLKDKLAFVSVTLSTLFLESMLGSLLGEMKKLLDEFTKATVQEIFNRIGILN